MDKFIMESKPTRIAFQITLFLGVCLGAFGGGLRAAAGADETAALASMDTLATALDMCALDTGYYVSLATLNDIPTASTPDTPWDYINYKGGTFVLRPDDGRFLPVRINLLSAYDPWSGPYINFQPGQYQTAATPYDQGSPLDPWGDPFYFFSPLGLLRGDSGAVTQELYGDAFDRYTIVSLGADGVMSGDDLIYEFDSGVSVTALTSVRGQAASIIQNGTAFSAPAGATVTVRGVNLGASQGSSRLFLNELALNAVQSWSDREIVVTLPSTPLVQGALTLRQGSFVSNPLNLTVTGGENAAKGWRLYP
jgi:hypothetical protein